MSARRHGHPGHTPSPEQAKNGMMHDWSRSLFSSDIQYTGWPKLNDAILLTPCTVVLALQLWTIKSVAHDQTNLVVAVHDFPNSIFSASCFQLIINNTKNIIMLYFHIVPRSCDLSSLLLNVVFGRPYYRSRLWHTVSSVCLSSVCLSVCDVLYLGKTAGQICMKFSGKVWTDHGTTSLYRTTDTLQPLRWPL